MTERTKITVVRLNDEFMSTLSPSFETNMV